MSKVRCGSCGQEIKFMSEVTVKDPHRRLYIAGCAVFAILIGLALFIAALG